MCATCIHFASVSTFFQTTNTPLGTGTSIKSGEVKKSLKIPRGNQNP
jgi:hypothetical protein